VSDERLLGTFTDVSGEDFEVLAKGKLVMLRGDQCSTVLLGPEARDELRGLLDRAATTGQRPAADGEFISPSCNYEVVDDVNGRMVDVGADLGRVEIAGYKVPLPAARELATGLAASIGHCEAWLAENRGDEPDAMPGQPGAAGEAGTA